MSAPKRTPTRTTWLSPRETPDPPTGFSRKVLSYAGAKGAFKKVTSEGLHEDMLWRHLWGLANLAKSSGKKTAWYALPGLAPHTLRRFPARVRSWAGEIDAIDRRLRSSSAYGATVALLPVYLAGAIPNSQVAIRIGRETIQEIGAVKRTVPAALARSVLQRHADIPKLADLPGLLRFYADYMDAVVKLTAHHSSKAPAFLDAAMPLELIEAVKQATGKPHYDEIATLLTAANHALGLNKIIDPRNLREQYSRRSRKK